MKNIILIEALVKALLATKKVSIEETDWDSCRNEETRDIYNVKFGNMNIKSQKKNSYVLTTDLYPVEIELGYDEEGKATSFNLFVGVNYKFTPMICIDDIQRFENNINVIEYIGRVFCYRFDPLIIGDFQIHLQNYKKGILTIGRLCPICEEYHTVDINKDQFENWLRWYFAEPGYEHIQDALPELSAKERELFITGIDDECFQSMNDSFDEE